MICKYCGEEVSNSIHFRWCKKNPNYQRNVEAQAQRMREIGPEQVKRAWVEGRMDHIVRNFKGTPHTEKSKALLREKALASKHRRLVRSIRDYIKKDGTVVKLDSSWEEKLAIRLDELGVLWDRPDCMEWIDVTGKKRHYFPDFYLPEYGIYLDPKNPAAMKQQNEKVTWLKLNRPDVIFLVSEIECRTFDPSLLTSSAP